MSTIPQPALLTHLQAQSYKLAWQRTVPGLELDGVEFKCLPSGLHSVKEDLVYFVQGTHAGVSAFVQKKADAQHRNAVLVCVGALVPLAYGRLGRSWSYAPELRRLAREQVRDGSDCRGLELFWTRHKDTESRPTSSLGAPPGQNGAERKRKRAQSDASGHLSTGAQLTPDLPALSMTDLLQSFGPLIFPIHRAALLRKRILLLGSPPVQKTCNFVYNLSILANLPRSLEDVIQSDSPHSLSRIRPFFSVGVHDIPFLSGEQQERNWLACTTDDILGEKKTLYDVIVRFPSQAAAGRQFPQILTSDGKKVKATQRDLRRYRLLRAEVHSAADSQHPYTDNHGDQDAANGDDGESLIRPLLRTSTDRLLSEVHRAADPGDHLVCEPVSWSAMAYNGVIWWASAGEMAAWESEEAKADRELLDEIPEPGELMSYTENVELQETTQRRIAEATVLTAYFHHITTAILQTLADVVADADDETEEGVADEEIVVTSEDVRRMGLDVWSAEDDDFVTQAARLYFDREAKVDEGQGVRVCGLRLC